MSMTKIAEIVVGAGGQASIDFANIPQTFTDLKIVFSTRDANNVNGYAVCGAAFMLNGSTANQAARLLYGSGSGSGASGTYSTLPSWHPSALATANTFSNVEFYIANYASAANKTVAIDGVTENNAAFCYQFMLAGLWASTAAVNRATLTAEGYFAQGSTATLYGVTRVPAEGIQPKATGGDIYQNGAYTYHVFKASGTFTPTQTIPNAEVLCIAGGGGGAGRGSGAGAGGVLSANGQSLASGTPLTVTVGAGGNGGTWSSGTGTSGGQGSNSVVGSFTAIGGGRGAGWAAGGGAGFSGGSGSGGDSGAGGTGTIGQGYDGGASNAYHTGGGGGSAAAGTASNGGSGTNLYSAWLNATSSGVSGFIAGGGGGGYVSGAPTPTLSRSGGAGGGTSGMWNDGVSASAPANTGSGSGGTGITGGTAGSGGSGIVIIRYA